MKAKLISEHIDWTGKWIPDKESPFNKASEYSVKQDLIKKLLEVTKKYQGILKDETIADAANYIVRKYTK
jgi:hypothetical protein